MKGIISCSPNERLVISMLEANVIWSDKTSLEIINRCPETYSGYSCRTMMFVCLMWTLSGFSTLGCSACQRRGANASRRKTGSRRDKGIRRRGLEVLGSRIEGWKNMQMREKQMENMWGEKMQRWEGMHLWFWVKYGEAGSRAGCRRGAQVEDTSTSEEQLHLWPHELSSVPRTRRKRESWEESRLPFDVTSPFVKGDVNKFGKFINKFGKFGNLENLGNLGNLEI